jgi:hypothetical protein
MREHVAPILEKELLPHFTDHGPNHGDRVAMLAGQLVEPIQDSKSPLSSDELFVLYAACYLHDIGMHVEATGDLRSTAEALRGLGFSGGSWDGVQPETRSAVTREHHHRMAAELVLRSRNAATPPIGFQFVESDNPGAIALVCEAHAEEFGSELYAQLTRESGTLRCSLITAILRIADILDESSARAPVQVRRSLELNLDSQVHWYRHYYTRAVRIDPANRCIELHFEFPPSKRAEYEKLVPELQVPAIDREVRRHTPLLGGFGGGWFVKPVIGQAPYVSVEEMPEDVFAAMYAEVHRQRGKEAQVHRQQELNSFEEAVPALVSQLGESPEKISAPEDYLALVERVAKELRGVGAKRTAWNALSGPFGRLGSLVSPARRVDLGLLLADLGLECGFDDSAARVLAGLQPVVAALEEPEKHGEAFGRLLARALIQMGAHAEAKELLKTQVQSTIPEQASVARAQLAELALLLGELNPWPPEAVGRRGGDA